MHPPDFIPRKERRKIRDRKIRAFHSLGYSLDEICAEMKKSGNGVSKTTVFFAVNGRSTKKTKERKKDKKAIKSKITNLL